jgi:hypothetical protein
MNNLFVVISLAFILISCSYNLASDNVKIMSNSELCNHYTNPKISPASKHLVSTHLKQRKIICESLYAPPVSEQEKISRNRDISNMIIDFSYQLGRIFTPY